MARLGDRFGTKHAGPFAPEDCLVLVKNYIAVWARTDPEMRIRIQGREFGALGWWEGGSVPPTPPGASVLSTTSGGAGGSLGRMPTYISVIWVRELAD